jgi:TonB family protein
MKLFKNSLIISILIHIVIFVFIAWIKIDNEYHVSEKVSVALLEKKQDRLIKRSIPTRQVSLLNDKTSQYMGTTVNLNVTNQPSFLIYSENQSPRHDVNMSNIIQIGDIVIKDRLEYRPITRPMATPIKQDYIKILNPRIDNVSGSRFVTNTPSFLEKPNISFIPTNSESLKKFLASVRKKIESNKKYPFSAMSAGIEGRCGVYIAISMDGKLENVEIHDSSGNELLDNAALESVRNSSPFPPIPSDIGRNRIEMSIYLVFTLSQMGR